MKQAIDVSIVVAGLAMACEPHSFVRLVGVGYMVLGIVDLIVLRLTDTGASTTR